MLQISDDVQKLIDRFDLYNEPNLEFDDHLKTKFDEFIRCSSDWDLIACSCRRIIICDREMDLETGLNLISIADDTFKSLVITDNPYESIRYINSCGLINYRCGNYPSALVLFKKAHDLAEKFNDIKVFLPDTKSNIIRTEFELYYQVLPDKIPEERKDECKIKINSFIKTYKDAIDYCKAENAIFNKKKIFYGHGMASLYHNLAETYISIFKKGELLPECYPDGINDAKKANEKSLEYGEEYNDIYRQLQSKRALLVVFEILKSKYRETVDEELINRYEREVLNGKWKRGKSIIYQEKIKRATNQEEVTTIIKNNLNLDINSEDKMGLLYNYDSIKVFLRNNPNVELRDSTDNPLTFLTIADAKLCIAEKLQNVFSALLYKRQVIRIIRDDIACKTRNLLDNGKYDEAIEFTEKYNCRSTLELAELIQSGEFHPTDKQKENVELRKLNVCKKIEEEGRNNKQKSEIDTQKSLSTSIMLSNDINVDYLDLLLAYEDMLKSPIENINSCVQIESNLVSELIMRLGKIPKNKETLVIKFMVVDNEKSKDNTIWIFFITRDKIKKVVKLEKESHIDLINQIKATIQDTELKESMGAGNSDLYKVMAKLNDAIKLRDTVDTEHIKNIFIIPDGELFQFPLHLINKDGEDLRENFNVFYSPSIRYILKENNLILKDEVPIKYLWISSPYNEYNNLCNEKEELEIPSLSSTDTLLTCKNATIERYMESLNSNRYNYICFSTHCYFNNNIVTSYASNIMLYNSFITPYDFLMSPSNFESVKNVFIGACSGGSCKYTDENEVVGLVTSLLSRNVQSIIAPLWKIHPKVHDNFIGVLKENWSAENTYLWDLSYLVQNSRVFYKPFLIPFVQYTNLQAVE